jgi:ER-bound oxygenase mpaB/B'/Rubber oxygenase, catalytic domain
MLSRTHWQRHIARLDPETDYEEIYRILGAHEFPWDLHQSLSFALFRTYAVPSIGRLLAGTGELERRTQKRYDDTVLLLDEPLVAGLRSDAGRRAIRRVNQMHGAYDIDPADMRYVLSTFVVVPRRWLEDYGWRPLSGDEVRASVRYYQELGRLMGIKDVPATYAGFEELMDTYEAEHFAFDEGGRRVADATMRLLVGFYPSFLSRPVELFSRALMDEPLLAAFGFRRPPRLVVRAARAGLRARGRIEAVLPARRRPLHSADLRRIRSYPDGYQVDALGTFPRGCPVPHETDAPVQESA